MELKQLQYFITVAESLNFSRAAESLYVSQPALSYQIAELEQELGQRLFTRDKRHVYLTPAGGALLPLARAVLNDVQRLKDRVHIGFPQESPTVPLSISFDSTEDHFEATGVTEALAAFHKQYPQVGLELKQASYDHCIEELLEGKLDLAFLILHHNTTLPPPLTYHVVHQDELVLVVRDTPDVTNIREALDKYALVLANDHPRGDARMMRSLENLGFSPNIMTADSIPVSFTYVQSEIGCICLPKNYFSIHRYEHLKAFEIPDPGATLMHVMAWNRSIQNPSVQLMLTAFTDNAE